MCCRYTLQRPAAEIAKLLHVPSVSHPQPRYNVAPTQNMPVVLHTAAGGRQAVSIRWGLSTSAGGLLVNARSETAAEKPAFRNSFRMRRCVVPADGFYEWQRSPDGPLPWLFAPANGEMLMFAALWDTLASSGTADATQAFTILTTAPNSVVAAFHDRMPAILSSEDVTGWLDPASTTTCLAALLKPAPASLLRPRAVHPRLNHTSNDDEACLAQPPAPRQGQLELGLG
jgi:putative SOS response-associated peptidase YedK